MGYTWSYAVRDDHLEKLASEQRSEGAKTSVRWVQGKDILGTGNRKYKGTEVGMNLAYSWKKDNWGLELSEQGRSWINLRAGAWRVFFFSSEHSESLPKGVKQRNDMIWFMFCKSNLDCSLGQQEWKLRDQLGACGCCLGRRWWWLGSSGDGGRGYFQDIFWI